MAPHTNSCYTRYSKKWRPILTHVTLHTQKWRPISTHVTLHTQKWRPILYHSPQGTSSALVTVGQGQDAEDSNTTTTLSRRERLLSWLMPRRESWARCGCRARAGNQVRVASDLFVILKCVLVFLYIVFSHRGKMIACGHTFFLLYVNGLSVCIIMHSRSLKRTLRTAWT